MRLVIAEKPSVAQALADVLGATKREKGYIEGNGYIVSWCLGHLVGLAEPDNYDEKYKTWSFENLPIIPTAWHMNVASDKRTQFNIIKSLLHDSRVDDVVCATDAGREGECIFRYVYKLSRGTIPVKRLWVSSNEESEIKKGFANLKDDSEYDNLYAAGLCRAKADWLIGMNLSRIFTLRYGGMPLSIGRVKTPTLAMIVNRDDEISNFVKKKYYTVSINCGDFTAESERIDDEEMAKQLAERCNSQTANVTEVEKEVKTSNPPKLFSLSALQTEVNKRLSLTAKQTLDIAQSLYDSDKKLTTYPRTNSQYLTDDMEQSTLDIIEVVHNSVYPAIKIDYTPNVKRCINSKKVEDHHAIIPTQQAKSFDFSSLKDNERNVYKLICERLLIATAPAHKYESTKVTLNCAGTDFKATGKVVIEDGYKAVEKQFSKPKDDKEDKSLPPISEGNSYSVVSEIVEHWTTPPAPYTDGTLISAMKSVGKTGIIDDSNTEIRGIGTEATRADIIEELVRRKYIERNKNKLSATKIGRQLVEVVPEEVKSPQMTADWETQFFDIEKGKAEDSEFLTEIENYIRDMFAKYGEKDSSLTFSDEPVGICPLCSKNVLERKTFYACESGKNGCGFGMNKVVCKKTITAAQMRKLLADGKTDFIKGFESKSGKKFDAFLSFKDGKIGFEFKPKAEKNVIGRCPKCNKLVVETPKAYSCESGKDGCGFVIWKTISGRNITPAIAKQLVETRETELVQGFKSKSGKKFNAHLILNSKDMVEFSFK